MTKQKDYENEQIRTTLAKAKELRPLADRMITHGKKGGVHHRRLARRWLPDRGSVRKLFDDIAPRFEERAGGYTRIIKLGPRRGDGAEMALLEFVEKGDPVASTEPKGKQK